MAGITIDLSILTLDINGLNSPIKRHRAKCQWLTPVILAIQEARDEEDHGLKPAQVNSLRYPILKKYPSQKKDW
jgi:hypothetical protein